MKQNRILIIGFFCVALGVCFSSCQKSILIEGRSSSAGSFWNENLAIQVKKSVPDETVDVVIRTDQKQQQVDDQLLVADLKPVSFNTIQIRY
ncbi:MAG: hypothetical protein JEZ14_20525 [Marinilabiliaceae bacterium]|nr:hypothetical protein [Marinilabiliaceae bacterium]